MIKGLTLSTGLLIALAGHGQANTFLCPGFGDVDVRVTFLEGTNAAVAEFIAGADSPSGGTDPVTLRSQPVASGFRYAGGDIVLVGDGGIADLTAGDITVRCALETDLPTDAPAGDEGGAAQSLDTGEATVDASGSADIPAVSLGGNLRSGPGTEFETVGSLDEGTPITLIVDTGVVFDGYTWWEVEPQGGGPIAFQWGGVICVPSGGVAGVLEDAALCNGAAPAEEEGVGEATSDAAGGLNIPALSLGGNLRSGPGTAFPDIGGLQEGTPIVLLSDSGITFDGYTWWEIAQPSGEVAFQWGGVICVPAGGVEGVLESCE
ncbi:hypothetical protein [Hasllibacter sp. MH4015]|uniref:hypothetical protein n=1 Tax=Hasllibacter sp. MH4015 TaxID=2854029 RepID=UPI001CD211BE|nr:hypothetical protein [Hasllibacter sp. MH4015]